MKNGTVLVYWAGPTPTKAEEQKVTAKIKGYTDVKYRNGKRFNFKTVEGRNEQNEPITRILMTDAEPCDRVVTDVEQVREAYKMDDRYDPELVFLTRAEKKKKSGGSESES